MINEADIEAFRDDAETFDRVNARYLAGVTQHREMTAQEVPAYMRHAMRLEWAVKAMLADKARRDEDSFSPGEPEYSP